MAVMRMDSMIRAGHVMEPGGAWDFFRSQQFPEEHRPLAASMMTGALENLGQECVNDYVQSTTSGLKARMLRRAAEAYGRLQTMRPGDRSIEMKRTFCEGRALIAAGRFEEAVPALQASLRIDNKFACAHNALGVAYARLNRPDDSRASFERAWELAPEWFLPPLQMAQQYIAAGNMKRALPLLEKAVKLNPRAPVVHWAQLRVLRVLKKDQEFAQRAAEMTAAFPNYAPAYLEVAAFHEARGDVARAVQAYDAYLTLAPNFEDSLAVRGRAEKLRSLTTRKPPTLYPGGRKPQ
jgi:tetratricopeptide (TPR) repeat protein